MKKTLSLILSVLMVLSLLTVAVSAAPNYDTAKDGDVLYTVDFSGTDGIYSPINFRNGNAKMEATTYEVTDGGKTLTATAPADAGAAWFLGGAFKGLTLGADKKYTITFEMAFPSGNAGVYFNYGYATKDMDALKDMSYNGLYGIYGKLTGTSITMSRAAGGKITGDLVSKSSGYTALPTDAQVANDTMANIRFEIDGYFYSVFVNDVLYDHVDMMDKTKCTYTPCENLGLCIYLYNKNAKTTISNVVVKKGCSYTKAAAEAANPGSTYTGAVAPATVTKIDYAAAANGDKLADLVFNATTGSYVATELGANSSATTTISEDGKSYTSAIGGTAAGEWYGGTIGGLKVADGNKYTFTYKVKTVSDSTYVLGIAYNSSVEGLGYRLNWYGAFTNTNPTFKFDGATEPNVKNAVKYAFIGTNFSYYGYTDDNMRSFTTFEPALDADGFADVLVELDGWTWSYYCKDASGEYKKIQTVDNKALLKNQLGCGTDGIDELAFILYTYNKNVTATVKDVALYKGLTVTGDNGSSTPTTPDAPATGDNTVWFVIVGAVSLLGTAIVIRRRENA